MENKRLVIVGTAHVSPKSIRDVEETIEKEMPEAVAIELDRRRFHALTRDELQDIPILDVIRKGETHLLIFQLLLSYFQKRIGDTYGVKPGEEMIAAVRKAKEINVDVILIDRDIGITLKRFWASLSLFEKLKLVGHLIMDFIRKEEVEIDEVLEEDVLELLVKEFRDIAPSAARVLIDERDAYMASNLIKSLNKYDKLVAVVGAGHKKGIERYLMNPESIPDTRKLEEIKKSRINLFKLFGYTVFGIIILIFSMLFMTLNSELIIRAFIYWFLINGILSAIGAAIARGHPFSIAAAFFFAWFTSLNPAIAAGWVSGAVEAWVRKPTASDLRKISRAESLGEVFSNKFFRVLLVAALTNVGSMIGTFMGAYYVLQITGIDIVGTLKEGFANVINTIFGIF
ncbi:MAG TPA: TraB/GumN family protein [Archaeoglobaceae archaeon]|nr:TraB/GumN family protein [Archaeoglobaceae archaeon]